MYRIDTPNNTGSMPTPSAVGTQGYFQDTDPAGSTSLTADFFNHVQEELAGVIEGLGLTLDKADVGQMWTALEPRVSGILSDGVSASGSTDHVRAIVASDTCTASANYSATVAAYTSTASGSTSAVLAGHNSTAVATRALATATQGSHATDSSAVVIGSINAENSTSYSVGGGYDGSGITASSANQNLSWLIESNGGNAHFAGDLEIGGDVDAGTGATVTVTGSTGAVACASVTTADLVVTGGDFQVNAAGDLDIGSGNATVDAGSGDITTAGDVDASAGTVSANTLEVGGGAGSTGVTLNNVGAVTADGVISTQSDIKCGAGQSYWVDTTQGASGSFTSADGKTITVTGGIITGIV